MKLKDINKENAIIEQTLGIVFETGIAGVKMSKLAKRVGISPSTLYVYFETKEDLIVSIGLKILKEIAESLDSALSGEISFEKKFRTKWMHMLQFMINHEKEINFIDNWKQSPYFNQESSIAWKEKGKSKSDLYEEGRAKGILKDLNDHITHGVMSGMAKQTINLIKEGHLQMDQTSMDLAFNLVWDALKK